MTKPVLLFEHPACGLHDPGPAHPEGTSRLPALLGALAADRELEGRLERRLASPASDEDLLRVHTPEHVASVRAAATRAASTSAAVSLDLDTAASARSWEAALAAAGCAVSAADAVVAGSTSAAFALARPPGHHAIRVSARHVRRAARDGAVEPARPRRPP